MSRRLLTVLAVLTTTFVLAAQGQDRLPVKVKPKNKGDVQRSEDKTDPKIKIGDAANQQATLQRQFDDFKAKLLSLAQRMENSSKPEEREKAKILRQAIKKASEEGVDSKFITLIDILKSKEALTTEQLTEFLAKNEELRKNLREIMDLLMRDDRDSELRKEIERVRKLLEELKHVIRKQELVLNKTVLQRSDNKSLEKEQNKVRRQTDNLINPNAGKQSQTKPGDSKGSKSGKKGLGESKDDTKAPKADSKESKKGDDKEGKKGDSKSGKPGDSKAGQSKPSASKPSASKPSQGKPSAGKPNAGQPSAGKGKGQGKGEGKGKSGDGKPGEGKSSKGGQSGQSGQQGQSKGGGGESGKQQQQQQPSSEQAQIKKKIQDAEKYQERAEDNLRKDNRKDAPDDEEKALDQLRAAKKQLEDLLRQLREEEIERLLAKLEGRCRKMLAMQIEVRNGTVELDKTIKGNPKQQPERQDQQASNVLSDKEDEIVKEARAGLRLLEAEGSAVAFAEVFQQVKGDMETVSTRLRKTDTGVITVTIENQIIETLQEMIEALKKAQADMKNRKQQPPGPSGPPPDPKLIDLLAELKMIRSMQKRVNARTELYGKQYSGEQAPPPDNATTENERERFERIQSELKDLSKRQKKISKVTHDIATGKNEGK